MADDEQKVNVIELVAKISFISDYAGSYFVEFLAHLVGLSHHWHQLDVVVEDSKQEGIRLTGSRTRLTYAHNVTLSLNVLYINIFLAVSLHTEADAFSCCQFRLEVVAVVAAPVIHVSLRGVTNEQVGAV